MTFIDSYPASKAHHGARRHRSSSATASMLIKSVLAVVCVLFVLSPDNSATGQDTATDEDKVKPDNDKAKPDEGKVKPYANHKYVQVDLESYEDIELMRDLDAALLGERPHLGRNLYVVAPQSMKSLRASGIPYKVIHKNFQEIVDAERERMEANRVDPKAPTRMTAEGTAYSDWYQDYKTYDDIVDRFAQWPTLYINLVDHEGIGYSWEGRQIYAIRIGYQPSNKPKVLITATQHAREWLAAMVAMYIADSAIAGYYEDPYVKWLLDRVELIIVPVANPDGFVATHEGFRLWRKNRHDDGSGCPYGRYNSYGVDLNRNWGHHWGTDNGGAEDGPCDDLYLGTEPFSEPETWHLSNFMSNESPIFAHIDLHAYGMWGLWPWGWYDGDDIRPFDEHSFWYIGKNMEYWIEQVHASDAWGPLGHPEQDYKFGGGGDFFGYVVNGAIDDWTYATLGTLSYAFELRPSDYYCLEPGSRCDPQDPGSMEPFGPEPGYILATGQEIWPAVTYALGRAECTRVLGPITAGTHSGCAILADSPTMGDVTFTATDYIHLKPGFQASGYSHSFRAYIE